MSTPEAHKSPSFSHASASRCVMLPLADTLEAGYSHGGPAPKVPPYNLEAEESLLGAMLMSRDAIAEAVQVVAAGDFCKPARGHVFDAISSLYGAGEPADPVTVADELRRAETARCHRRPGRPHHAPASTPATSNARHFTASWRSALLGGSSG